MCSTLSRWFTTRLTSRMLLLAAAQTLPHEIRLSPTGDSLLWLPLPEMASLHSELRSFSGSYSNGSRTLVNGSDTFGRHMHAQANFTLSGTAATCDEPTLAVNKEKEALCVQVKCGATTAELCVLASTAVAASRPTPQPPDVEVIAVPLPRGGRPGSAAAESLIVEVFVDSVIVEIFAGGAHVAHTLEGIDGESGPSTGVVVGVSGGRATVEVDLWSMDASISPACPGE